MISTSIMLILLALNLGPLQAAQQNRGFTAWVCQLCGCLPSPNANKAPALAMAVQPKDKDSKRATSGARANFHAVVGVAQKKVKGEDRFMCLANPLADVCWIGVFDGHGERGHLPAECAQVAFTQMGKIKAISLDAFKDTFSDVDKKCEKMPTAGTTASVVVIDQKQLVIAHVGDSRVVVAKKDEKQGVKVAFETKDHQIKNVFAAELLHSNDLFDELSELKLHSVPKKLISDQAEFDRLKRERARITGYRNDCLRLDGAVVCYRVLGDYYRFSSRSETFSKIRGSTCDPEIKIIPLDDSYKFVIAASDGVWDYVTSEEAIQWVEKQLNAGLRANAAAAKLLDLVSEKRKANNRGSDDETVVIAVLVRDPNELSKN